MNLHFKIHEMETERAVCVARLSLGLLPDSSICFSVFSVPSCSKAFELG